MLEAVKKYFPKDTKVVVPEGGLFMWLELNPAIIRSNCLIMFLPKTLHSSQEHFSSLTGMV